MKKLFIALLAVLMVAGFVYAAEEEASIFNFSGMINTRGSYISNEASTSDDAPDYMYYDMEFDSTLDINPSDKTFIRLNWEIHDENFGPTPTDSETKTGDNNIAFKRAWGKYTFDNGMSTSFGLMTGGAFGTAFGDNANGAYRVRLDGMAGFGKWGVILQKNQENGTSATSDWEAEKDDSDAYYAYLVTKAGDVTLQFLGIYSATGDATGANTAPGGLEEEGADVNTYGFIAAAMGSFGAIGFEAEIDYLNSNYEWSGADPSDSTVYGLYGNVWTTMDAVKIGAMAAYGSWDKDAGRGFGFGEDFGPGFWVMDWDAFGGGPLYQYYASTLLAVYADFSVNDDMSLYGALEYMMSNTDAGAWEDATGIIANFGLTYKLADNATYSIGAAYGQYEGGEWGPAGDTYDDPDAFTRVYHKIQINF